MSKELKHQTRNFSGVKQVLSPYRNEARDARLSKLYGRTSFDGELVAMVLITTYAISALLGLLAAMIWAGTEDGLDLSEKAGFITTGGISGSVTLYFVILSSYQAYTHVVSKRLEREQVPEWIAYDGLNGTIVKLAETLASLEPNVRAELRPLWDSALASHRLLMEGGPDRAADARVQARLEAAQKVLEEQKALAAAAQKDAAVLEYGVSEDDSDLRLAEAHAEALRAGRETYLALESNR